MRHVFLLFVVGLCCVAVGLTYVQTAQGADCANPFVFYESIEKFRWDPASGPVEYYEVEIGQSCGGMTSSMRVRAWSKALGFGPWSEWSDPFVVTVPEPNSVQGLLSGLSLLAGLAWWRKR